LRGYGDLTRRSPGVCSRLAGRRITGCHSSAVARRDHGPTTRECERSECRCEPA